MHASQRQSRRTSLKKSAMNSPQKLILQDQSEIPSFMVFSKKSSKKSLDRDIKPESQRLFQQNSSVNLKNHMNYSQDAYVSVNNADEANRAYNTKKYSQEDIQNQYAH